MLFRSRSWKNNRIIHVGACAKVGTSPFYFDTTCVEVVSATSVHVGQKLDVDGFENSAQVGQNYFECGYLPKSIELFTIS